MCAGSNGGCRGPEELFVVGVFDVVVDYVTRWFDLFLL